MTMPTKMRNLAILTALLGGVTITTWSGSAVAQVYGFGAPKIGPNFNPYTGPYKAVRPQRSLPLSSGRGWSTGSVGAPGMGRSMAYRPPVQIQKPFSNLQRNRRISNSEQFARMTMMYGTWGY